MSARTFIKRHWPFEGLIRREGVLETAVSRLNNVLPGIVSVTVKSKGPANDYFVRISGGNLDADNLGTLARISTSDLTGSLVILERAFNKHASGIQYPIYTDERYEMFQDVVRMAQRIEMP